GPWIAQHRECIRKPGHEAQARRQGAHGGLVGQAKAEVDEAVVNGDQALEHIARVWSYPTVVGLDRPRLPELIRSRLGRQMNVEAEFVERLIATWAEDNAVVPNH